MSNLRVTDAHVPGSSVSAATVTGDTAVTPRPPDRRHRGAPALTLAVLLAVSPAGARETEAPVKPDAPPSTSGEFAGASVRKLLLDALETAETVRTAGYRCNAAIGASRFKPTERLRSLAIMDGCQRFVTLMATDWQRALRIGDYIARKRRVELQANADMHRRLTRLQHKIDQQAGDFLSATRRLK